MGHRLFDGMQQLLRRYRLGQEIFRASLDGLHRGTNVGVAAEKDDRQGRAKLAQAILQFRAAQIGDADVKQDTSRLGFVRQTIEQLLRRRVGRNRITGLLQARLDRAPERSVVIYDVNGATQLFLLLPRQWYRETEHRSTFRLVLRPYPSLVCQYDGARDRETYSRTLLLAREERIKDFSQLFRWNARTRVGNRDNGRRSPIKLAAADHRAAIWHRRHGLHAVEDQVQDDLLQLNGVTPDPQRLGAQIVVKRDVAARRLDTEKFEDFAHDVVEIQVL